MASDSKSGIRRGGKVSAAPAGRPVAQATVVRESDTRIRVREAIQLNDTEMSELCVESLCSLGTIRRWANGEPVTRTTKLRLEAAMEKIGIERREKKQRETARRRVVEVGKVA